MAYSYLSFVAAAQLLAARLEDQSLVYWNQPSELTNCLIEALRFFQCLTASYKQRITFATQKNVNYYDLPNLTAINNGAAVAYHVTDVEVVNNVLAALIEPPLTFPAWTGTGQFTLLQLQGALQQRLNQFLGDTGCRVVQQTISGPPPPVDLVALPDIALDVRRAAWLSSSSPTWDQEAIQWQQAGFNWNAIDGGAPLGRIDEWASQAYVPDAIQSPCMPIAYSLFGVPPAMLRLVPPPRNGGLIDCLLVSAGPQIGLNPAAPVVLQIPDDLTPALKWGMLADLLGSDGPSRDYARAAYCEQRYQEFVQLARIYPSVLTGDINNVTCGTGSVFDLDFYQPDWQQTTGIPSFIGMCGRNMICMGQTPDQLPPGLSWEQATTLWQDANFSWSAATMSGVGPYSIGLWLCANAPVLNQTYVQVSRDQISAILDYAQHIACFKMGGVEFDGTSRLYENIINCAARQNNRLNAISFYRSHMQQQARRDETQVARMSDSSPSL